MSGTSRAARTATAALSEPPADEVKTSTCYMCACRCGIKVHLKQGRIRYIEGNRDHPVNRGVLCGKGAAGIMKQYSPARLSSPLRRVGERGSGEFEAIGWDEALEIVASRLARIRAEDPRKLAFFTGRDQSQALTSWWARQFGTPNYAAHGGFCSVNMAAAGLYTLGGSFWEFGEPDWEHSRYFMMFGVAEDHASNPIKIGLGKLKGHGAKFVSVNPVRTGYSAIADEWLGIRPGSDGLFVFAIIHELLRSDRVDFAFLSRYTNAPWLVIDDPGAADHGLFARGADGEPLARDGESGALVDATTTNFSPSLVGAATLADGRRAVPAFELFARRYLDPANAPEAVAAETGLPAETIRRVAGEIAEAAFESEVVVDVPWTDWTGRRHETMIGRPVSFHAMRGISAHSNGFHTCRAIHLLQMLLGAVDAPGSFRYRPPYPQSIPPAPPPAGHRADVRPGQPLPGMPLGFIRGPEDLLIDETGKPERIDKAFSWDAPLAAHGMMHMVIANAHAGDPYPIDTLLMFMANMSWNSAMNAAATMEKLTDRDPETGEYRIPFVVYSDAFNSEMVAYADIVLPDTTYLERHDCISLLDRPISDADGAADGIRQPIVTPDRDVRPFQDVLLDLGARLGLPGLVDEAGAPLYPGGLPDYMTRHERRPGVGMLSGWRGADGKAEGRGAVNPDQLDRYKENGCFWRQELTPEKRYFRFANRDYLDHAEGMGWRDVATPITLELYSETLQKFRLAAEGHGPHQPPDDMRERIAAHFDPLPIWHQQLSDARLGKGDYPFHAITQRPMVMYHAWDSQNAWQRQILGRNRIYLHRGLGERLGIADDDWIWLTSAHGRVRAQARLMDGVNPDTVWTWNAIGKRRGTWGLSPDAPESREGFLLNHLISEFLPGTPDAKDANIDPVTGQAAWYDLKVRIEKATPEEAGTSWPQFEILPGPRGEHRAVHPSAGRRGRA
ncbi:molybdopterin oxidoreductase family protein [Oceanibacterium hippocampi]|uniref:Tetrathionate reductase subunit A n=1 Tax=Oceanibacterium hippocampi TaxID=745714 RepID=A0A1Y5TY48_9PROT|nr:molybdopterin oxidoreductase family protein [Oceanibacterium hippocampi]SLN76248.1 Tetrathionate reductase subunit A precursor [Oceanibacterium hippocampi]